MNIHKVITVCHHLRVCGGTSWTHSAFEILGSVFCCSLRVGYSCFVAQNSCGMGWSKAPSLLLLSTSQQVFIFLLLWLFWRVRMGLKGVTALFPVLLSTFLNLIQNLSPKCLVRPHLSLMLLFKILPATPNAVSNKHLQESSISLEDCFHIFIFVEMSWTSSRIHVISSSLDFGSFE